MNFYLTGFMGAGKSTVGRFLAALLGRPFLDLDKIIEERTESTIDEIFRSLGETGFRELESAILRESGASRPAVVATGGGVLSVSGNRKWLAEHGKTIFLDVPFDELLRRLCEKEQQRRPLFENETQTRALYQQRLRHYRDSDLRIEISSAQSAADVAALIRDRLEKKRCGI